MNGQNTVDTAKALGWGWAAFVWGYALAWALVNDRVKLLAYRVFDPTKAPLLMNERLGLAPQIATRAYELYKQRGRREGHADQDWLEAEREIRKDQVGGTNAASTVVLSPMSVKRSPRSS